MPSLESAAPTLQWGGKSTNCRHFSPGMYRLDGIERLNSNRTTLEMVNCMRATNKRPRSVGEQSGVAAQSPTSSRGPTEWQADSIPSDWVETGAVRRSDPVPFNLGMWRILDSGGSRGHGGFSRRGAHRQVG